MKSMLKIGMTVAVAGLIVWSIPPARTFVKTKASEFSSAFREAETSIRHQLLAEPPLTSTAAAPSGVHEDDEWF